MAIEGHHQTALPGHEDAAQTPKPPARVLVAVLLTLLGVSLAVTIYFLVDFRSGPPEPQPAPSSPLVILELPAGVTAEYRDGRYTVGEDMEPGTYRTVIPLTLFNTEYCLWSIRSANAEGPDDARHGAVSEGMGTMTVAVGDTVESSGCFGWDAVDPADFASATVGTTVLIPPGTWLVGPDLAPGLYRSPFPVRTHSLNPYCSLDLYADWSGSRQAVIATWAITGGYPVFEVELGQQIRTRGCGHFEKVTLEDLVAQAQPAAAMGDGIWLVGVDIQPGTYRETALQGADPYDCLVEVYHSAALDRDDSQHLFNESPESITVGLGEVVIARDCGQWELT